MTTVIASDLHLGARNARTDLVPKLLDLDFDRLILNGDTVDHLNFGKFQPRDWRVINDLRRISAERELILIRGNHDGRGCVSKGFGPQDLLAELLRVDLFEEYELDVGGDRYLVLHGDQYDQTLNVTWLGDAADWVYRQTQRGSKSVAHFLKAGVKLFGGVVTCVKRGAVAEARARGFAGVVTGHTHFWEEEWIDGIHYLNCGCWVDWPCSLVVCQGGDICVKHWHEVGGGINRREEALALS